MTRPCRLGHLLICGSFIFLTAQLSEAHDGKHPEEVDDENPRNQQVAPPVQRPTYYQDGQAYHLAGTGIGTHPVLDNAVGARRRSLSSLDLKGAGFNQ